MPVHKIYKTCDRAVADIFDGATIMIGGVSCIAGSIGFAAKLPSLREVARPTYVRLGIIPGKE